MSDNRTADLWLKIDQLHLKFLQAEETPAKLEIRKKLEGLVAEYLSLVPHERKFVSGTTGDLVANSAKWKPDFSLVKAANAFRAVEQYAANLINQPWRQEFWSIRQYSGFYKHSVETALFGPEKLFLEMGYSATPGQAQVLGLPQPRVGEHPVNIDMVTSVARDCVLACVECQLLADIHSGVVTQFPINLEEVVEFRRDHIGSIEVCVRELVYRKNQLRYQFPATSPQYGLQNYAYPGQPQPFPQTNGYPPVGFPGPGQIYPSPMNSFPPTSFPEYHHTQFPTTQLNGFPPHSVLYATAAAPVNGYSLHQAGPVAGGQPVPGQPVHLGQQPSQAHVPTGRLVEFEGGAGGVGQAKHSPAGSSTSTLRQAGQIPTTILELSQEPAVPERRGRHLGQERDNRHQEREQVERRHGEQGDRRHHGEGGARPREGRENRERSGKARNSGKEQDFDSWDYVYKHLEQTGYTKDQAERPDVLEGQQVGVLTSDSQSEREEELRRNIQVLRLREDKNGDGREATHGRGGRGSAQPRYSRQVETSESEQEAASKYDSAVSEERMEPVRQERNGRREQQPQRAARGQERGGGQGQGGPELWECITCTFHNKQSKSVCEMCSKSRDLPPVVVDPRGVEMARDGMVREQHKAKSATPPTPPPTGLVCGKCTLVNPLSAKICQACDCTLSLPSSKSGKNH